MHMVDLSFIVCTRNRVRVLPNCLDAIWEGARAAPAVGLELIIIDNGSTDGTREFVEGWMRSHPIDTRYLFEKKQGLSIGRNIGMRAARGKLFVFTDDDCRISIDYIPQLLARYAADAEPVIRGGRVVLGDPTDLPFTIKTGSEVRRLTDRMHPGAVILGCNMVVPREIVGRIGDFDERFGSGAIFKSAEDTEYLYRAYKSGVRVEFVPDLTVAHFHGRKETAALKQLDRDYNIGNGALYGKYFTDLSLLRHFFRDARNAVFELFGGRLFEENLGLTHASRAWGNIVGVVLYLKSGVIASFRVIHVPVRKMMESN